MRRNFLTILNTGWSGSTPQAKAKNKGKYGGTNKGTISSPEDMDEFIASYDIETGKFGDLALGDTITINDGIYNVKWAIGEFDYHCDAASTFDKDYVNEFHNIALVPDNGEFDTNYYRMYTASTCTTAYKGSKINLEVIPTIINNLKAVLGDHLKPFYQYVSSTNVALGSSVTAYEWLQKEMFLMSVCQLVGEDPYKYSIETVQAYEHKFPLMGVTTYAKNVDYWLRCMSKSGYSSDSFCYHSGYGNNIDRANLTNSCRLTPFITLG